MIVDEPARTETGQQFSDLREFLALVEGDGELRRFEGADWQLEIGAINEALSQRRGPMCLFDDIKGSLHRRCTGDLVDNVAHCQTSTGARSFRGSVTTVLPRTKESRLNTPEPRVAMYKNRKQ